LSRVDSASLVRGLSGDYFEEAGPLVDWGARRSPDFSPIRHPAVTRPLCYCSGTLPGVRYRGQRLLQLHGGGKMKQARRLRLSAMHFRAGFSDPRQTAVDPGSFCMHVSRNDYWVGPLGSSAMRLLIIMRFAQPRRAPPY
jgi:hypothetical protein